MRTTDWFYIQNVQTLDSPSLLVYSHRTKRNIERMIARSEGTERLIPHVKTNKMPAILELMLRAGVSRFKCATIAEAEMLALSGAKYVVIAHQLVPPKTARMLALKQKYPDVFFASLLDNLHTAQEQNTFFASNNAVSDVFLDVNNGMNRSGTPLQERTFGLYAEIAALPQTRLHGLHVYDGHLRDANFDDRRSKIESGFAAVESLSKNITKTFGKAPIIIAGGTPAFSSHSPHSERWCSPGTCVLWDWGYASILSEQEYEYAALVLTRIVSKPERGFITIDMGHKAIAAENPMEKRVKFLNLAENDYELVSQSEEHSVLRTSNDELWERLRVGDELYAVPYHVCPTVNLYDEAYWVEESSEGCVVTGVREVLGRKRRITV
jgi:D-serine deaminase-like pyridoxal phosphate-dependent protein